MSTYTFLTVWKLDAPIERVYAARKDTAARSRENRAPAPGHRMPSRMRLFNPHTLAYYETRNYVAYYQRDWLGLLRATVELVKESFGLNYAQAIYGAYLIASAEFAWAPQNHDLRVVENKLRTFYKFVRAINHETFDLDRAVQAELAWWIAHREHFGDPQNESIIEAFTDLNSILFQAPTERVRQAAYWRAAAVLFSDWWVEEGLAPNSPRIRQEEEAFQISYTLLRQVAQTPR